MKNFLLVFALLSILVSCKKDDPDPEPETPDYADQLVGTYMGEERYYDTDKTTILHSNASKTITIAKVEKNKIQISTFHSGASPLFTLSDGGNGTINIVAQSPNANDGSFAGANKYTVSSKALFIFFKSAINKYTYFTGDKQ